MKNKKLFNKTISILVNAYLKGTLLHSEACACVVGNLISYHSNYKVIIHEIYGFMWRTKEGAEIKPKWYSNQGMKAVTETECTGYTSREIIKIENAFERFDWEEAEEDQFNDDETGYLFK